MFGVATEGGAIVLPPGQVVHLLSANGEPCCGVRKAWLAVDDEGIIKGLGEKLDLLERVKSLFQV